MCLGVGVCVQSVKGSAKVDMSGMSEVGEVQRIELPNRITPLLGTVFLGLRHMRGRLRRFLIGCKWHQTLICLLGRGEAT